MNLYRENLQLEAENEELRNQVKKLKFEILLRDLGAARCPASDRPAQQGNWGSIVHCPVCEKQELMLLGSVDLPVIEAHDYQFRLPQ